MIDPHGMRDRGLDVPLVLPDGIAGVDAGLTLVKIVRGTGDGVRAVARETAAGDAWRAELRGLRAGVTGARAGALADGAAAVVQEIDAAARGAAALLRAAGRPDDEFLLILLGTGTGCAAVRSGSVTYMGGAALGGGSFAGIARRIEPSLTYEAMVAGAERGDRRNVDLMIADAYPSGIGRVGPDLTAAHLARAGGSLDDVLAGLLNLHGESIGQIAASRARMAGLGRVVLAGGFVHGNAPLAASITSMVSMFGVSAEVAPSPGYAGAIGAALAAADAAGESAAK